MTAKSADARPDLRFGTCPGPVPNAHTPAVDVDSRAYWTADERGELAIYRCAACRTYVQPAGLDALLPEHVS